MTSRPVKDPELAKHILLKTLKGLLSQMRKVTPALPLVYVVGLRRDRDPL